MQARHSTSMSDFMTRVLYGLAECLLLRALTCLAGVVYRRARQAIGDEDQATDDKEANHC